MTANSSKALEHRSTSTLASLKYFEGGVELEEVVTNMAM